MKNENAINLIEQKIIRLLYKAKVPLTIGQIAKEIGYTYPTVKKYVTRLQENGVIVDANKASATKKKT